MIRLVWNGVNHSLAVIFTFCLALFPHSTADKETGRRTVGAGWALVYEGRQWIVLSSVSLITGQPIHFIFCLSADLWQGVTIIRFIVGDVWESKGTCYPPHPARVNKTKKSYALKDLWGKKRGKEARGTAERHLCCSLLKLLHLIVRLSTQLWLSAWIQIL